MGVARMWACLAAIWASEGSLVFVGRVEVGVVVSDIVAAGEGGSTSFPVWHPRPLDPVATFFLAAMRALAAAITVTASVQYAFAWGAAGTRPTPSQRRPSRSLTPPIQRS